MTESANGEKPDTRRNASARKPKSLRTKLILYFVCFAIGLMALLWGLQVVAYQRFYESMKKQEIVSVANSFIGANGELDMQRLRHISGHDDMYIYIETADGHVLYDSHGSETPLLSSLFFPPESVYDTSGIRTLVAASETGTASFTGKTADGVSTIVYGKTVDAARFGVLYLSIFSPLEPVESTVSILREQLLIVTLISLVLAAILACFLSAHLSRPIAQITETAGELAKGNYGVTFEGSGYEEAIALADTLSYTSSELARTDELKKDLIANVSHDLRTPLTMIRSYAEMVRDLSGDNPEKRTEHLDVIIGEADRLNGLVGDLLTLSKLQSGSAVLKTAPFDLAEAAENALRAFRVLEETDGFRISFRTEGNGFTVTADYDRIRQVLANLLTNAFRYSGDSRDIELTVTADTSSVRCDVRDHGIGISGDDLVHIWDRYYRSSGQAVRSASGGSGLGLAITKEILELHGARYGVDSAPGEGSTFWFSLDK